MGVMYSYLFHTFIEINVRVFVHSFPASFAFSSHTGPSRSPTTGPLHMLFPGTGTVSLLSLFTAHPSGASQPHSSGWPSWSLSAWTGLWLFWSAAQKLLLSVHSFRYSLAKVCLFTRWEAHVGRKHLSLFTVVYLAPCNTLVHNRH